MKNILRSKKADLSITLLVIMTLLISSTSLLIFYTTENKADTSISQIALISDFYSQQDLIEYYVYNIAKKVVNNNKITSGQDFSERFRYSYYDIITKSFNSEDYYRYSRILNHISDPKNYESSISNNILTFKIKDFEFSQLSFEEGDIMSISYKKSITFQIPLKT